LRASDPVLREPARDRLAADAHGEVLAVRRWRNDEQRLLLVNFGDRPASLSALPATGLRAIFSSAATAELAPATALILSS
jgi:hypothetical protein